LHGGPGAACFPNHVRFFDPQRYDKVILLDQRGCGHSTVVVNNTNEVAPFRRIHHHNTLPLLIDDVEALRKHLNVPQFTTVLGGSWGSTLALGYAQDHPTRVHSLILRGVCAMRQSEVDWLFSSVTDSASKLFPEEWKEFENAVSMIGTDATTAPPAEDTRSTLNGYHIAFFTQGSDASSQQPLTEAETSKIEQVTRAWRKWEFLMSMAHKLPSQPNNNLNMSDQSVMMKALKEWDAAHSESPVVVAKKGIVNDARDNVGTDATSWALQDAHGTPVTLSSTSDPQAVNSELNARELAQSLRQNIGIGTAPDPSQTLLPLAESLLVRSDKIPAQALLTCHYSYYRDTCIAYNLLDHERMQRLRNVKCIAVQGGRDRICPPDTALDLCSAWPTSTDFELRMPIHAGHSMYDPFLTNELVKSTDHIADDFVRKRA
jgi:proline iminopeptidase